MAKSNGTGKVTVEVELAEPPHKSDGLFESVIKVRIIGVEMHAYQMVKEAVLLGIQTALGGEAEDQSDDTPVAPTH